MTNGDPTNDMADGKPSTVDDEPDSARDATSADGPNGDTDVRQTAEGTSPGTSSSAKKAPTRRGRATKKAAGKKVRAAKKASSDREQDSSGTRVQRSFPASSFEDAAELANTMHRLGSDRVRRLTLFDHLGRSAESGPSRQLIINSGRYGITTGGVRAEFLALTDDGKAATDPELSRRQRVRARFRLGIEGIEPFKLLYDEFADRRLPSQTIMRDFLREKGYADNEIQECIDTFIVNAKYIGLLRTVAGAERLLTLEHALDEIPIGPEAPSSPDTAFISPRGSATQAGEQVDWSKTCFYISPIGSDDSEERQHSDLFLGSFVEPALREFDLHVVRADQISKSGMITAQVIEHLANAQIVVADLSFHNPNVFYEIALRHATRKPIVQIIRAADRIPFDVDQLRTIKIDTTSIFALVPQIESYRSEIATQVRRALDGSADVENPITVFYTQFWSLINAAPQMT